MKQLLIFILVYLGITVHSINAQQFVNGDLEGIITGDSNLPPNWDKVPDTDPVCLAPVEFAATPDLTSLTLPEPAAGIIGNPYSGNTFISGLFGYGFTTNTVYDEGIMQTVSGFIPDVSYTIVFHQAVVKQFNCLDSSGSWAVFIDTTWAGTSAPTFSAAPYNSTSFIWDTRSITFVATETTHTIKFLPRDDDSNWNGEATVRMGIDCIRINPFSVLSSACDTLAGTDDNEFENSLTIFPNPFAGSLNIQSTGNKLCEFILYDLTARKIAEQSFTNSLEINTAQLANGIYIYEVRNKEGASVKGKVTRE
jgi:hypothetical protein